MNASHNVLTEAVRLLVDIAGPEPVHIEMSARGPKKYYDVHRRLMNEMPVPICRVIGPKARPSGIQMARRAPSVTMPIPLEDWQCLQEAARIWLADICRCWKPRRLVEVVTCGSSSPTWSVLRSLSSLSYWHQTCT